MYSSCEKQQEITRENHVSDVLDHINAMMEKEKRYYSCSHYTASQQKGLESRTLEKYSRLKVWRKRLVRWAFTVVDHFDVPRETVALAMSFYDRFLVTIEDDECTDNFVSLLSLTSLYLAVKLGNRRHKKVSAFAALSAGRFSVKDIENMEEHILCRLDFLLNPPTCPMFAHLFIEALPAETYGSMKAELSNIAVYLTELLMSDGSMVGVRASMIGFASVLQASKECNLRIPYEYLLAVSQDLNITYNSSNVQCICEKLTNLYSLVDSRHEVACVPESSPKSSLNNAQSTQHHHYNGMDVETSGLNGSSPYDVTAAYSC